MVTIHAARTASENTRAIPRGIGRKRVTGSNCLMVGWRLAVGGWRLRSLHMVTTRLEAFSDGVIAILITIMVLELRTPEGHDWAALWSIRTKFCAYVLSFVIIGIYWNNHHHMFHMTERVTGGILWVNLHLLFWLSLIPFGTAWVGDSRVAPVPTAVYGAILMFAGI